MQTALISLRIPTLHIAYQSSGLPSRREYRDTATTTARIPQGLDQPSSFGQPTLREKTAVECIVPPLERQQPLFKLVHRTETPVSRRISAENHVIQGLDSGETRGKGVVKGAFFGVLKHVVSGLEAEDWYVLERRVRTPLDVSED